jgi:hypothetical protein
MAVDLYCEIDRIDGLIILAGYDLLKMKEIEGAKMIDQRFTILFLQSAIRWIECTGKQNWKSNSNPHHSGSISVGL